MINLNYSFQEMADNQKEINEIFSEYAASEDPEVEDELDKLADELKEENQEKLPKGISLLFIIYQRGKKLLLKKKIKLKSMMN